MLSTLRYWSYPEWTRRVDIVDRGDHSTLGFLARVVAGARTHSAVVLTGTRRADQAAAVFLARLRPPPRVVMTDATWKRGGSPAARLADGLGMRGMRGPHLVFCVLSTWEVESFPRTWGVPPEQVRFTPFCFTLSEEELDLPVSHDGGVFAGGESLRDYGPLLGAARSVDARVTIAAGGLDGRGAPPNVEAGRVSHERFMTLLRGAGVVVVPLAGESDRSAGQQTYLNAMALGKPVIVTDAPGVRDYVDHGSTGLVVPPGDPASLASAISWVLDTENRDEVRRMCERAREDVRSRFTRSRYIERILEVVNGAP